MLRRRAVHFANNVGRFVAAVIPTGPASYFGAMYFGRAYFGQRYFG